MTFSDIAAEAARKYGSMTAITFSGERKVTFEALDEEATRLAVALTDAGFERGERIGVYLWNRPEYVTLYIALIRAGLVIVPVNRRAAAAEAAEVLSDAGARAFVAESSSVDAFRAMADIPAMRLLLSVGGVPDELPQVHDYDEFVAGGDLRDLRVSVDLDEIAAIHYTSGTSGVAKGVVRTHRANIATAQIAIDEFPIHPGAAWLHTLPMHSVGTYIMVLAPMMEGGSVILTERVDPQLNLRLAREENAVFMHMIPTAWEMMYRDNHHEPANLPHLQVALWGASPLLKGTADRLAKWLPVPLVGSYGASEVPGCCYSTADIYESGRWDAGGVALGGTELRVVDQDGNDVEPGVFGEVLVKGPTLMSGYLDKPEMTAAAIDKDGWYHSGDFGKVDADGVMTVTDRTKDMIISGGENIYPAEVESVISLLPDVVEVAVVGAPDEFWGQTVCAFVVAKDPGDEVEQLIVQHSRERLAGFKVPRRFVFVDEMPKSSLGKIEKHTLVASLKSEAAVSND